MATMRYFNIFSPANARKHLRLGISFTPEHLYVVMLDLSIPHSPELIFHDACAMSQMPLALSLQAMLKRHRWQGIPCMSVLGSEDYHLLLVEKPPVPKSELTAALRWRIQDLIDFSVDEAVLDVFELPITRYPAQQQRLYVVAAQQARIQRYSEALLEAGLELTAIDIPELALRNLAMLLTTHHTGVALLWLTERVSGLVLMHEGQVYLARALEMGTNTLWRQLQQTALHMQGAEAYADNAALQQAVQRIAVEIQRSLNYYENEYLQTPITQLWLAPFKYAFPEFYILLANQLDIEVQTLDLNGLLNCQHKLSRAEQSDYLLAIGAGLR